MHAFTQQPADAIYEFQDTLSFEKRSKLVLETRIGAHSMVTGCNLSVMVILRAQFFWRNSLIFILWLPVIVYFVYLCSLLRLGLRHRLPATSIIHVYLFVPHIFVQNYYDWSWNHRERNKLTHYVYFTHECRSRNIEFRAISMRVVRERDSAKKYVWKLYDFHCPLTSFRQHQNKT